MLDEAAPAGAAIPDAATDAARVDAARSRLAEARRRLPRYFLPSATEIWARPYARDRARERGKTLRFDLPRVAQALPQPQVERILRCNCVRPLQYFWWDGLRVGLHVLAHDVV